MLLCGRSGHLTCSCQYTCAFLNHPVKRLGCCRAGPTVPHSALFSSTGFVHEISPTAFLLVFSQASHMQQFIKALCAGPARACWQARKLQRAATPPWRQQRTSWRRTTRACKH